jgi:hypothetical protein
VAAFTLLIPADTELSLQQHLELTPDLIHYSQLVSEADAEPLMMAQTVPHQTTDKKRVKVYELRNNDWFDRGTGFCAAAFISVSAHCSTCCRDKPREFNLRLAPPRPDGCMTDLFCEPPRARMVNRKSHAYL